MESLSQLQRCLEFASVNFALIEILKPTNILKPRKNSTVQMAFK